MGSLLVYMGLMEANSVFLPAFLPFSRHHDPICLRCQHSGEVCLTPTARGITKEQRDRQSNENNGENSIHICGWRQGRGAYTWYTLSCIFAHKHIVKQLHTECMWESHNATQKKKKKIGIKIKTVNCSFVMFDSCCTRAFNKPLENT